MPTEPPDTCTECGSENIQPTSDQSEEFVCSDCGLVIGNSTNPIEDSDNSEWTAFDNSDDIGQSGESMEVMRQKMGEIQDKTDKYSTNNASVPETSDEWRMWYPCPECQSTALEQVTEQHLSVSATEDGSYGGDAGGIEEYNYVECRDCGEVLLDEIGRD